MSRIHYWKYIINSEGQVIPDTPLTIEVQTGGNAFVYLQESGGSPTDTAPQVTSDASGFVEFWVGNINETSGYPPRTKFKLSWTDDDGLVEIENVDIVPNTAQFTSDTTSLWTSAAGGEYYYDMVHGLQNNYPLVQCWNQSTDLMQEPVRISRISNTTTRIFMDNNTTILTVSVLG
jgi:hypothetical protein